MRCRRSICALFVAALSASGQVVANQAAAQDSTVFVGSKLFTEAVILGDIATQVGRSVGVSVEHRRQLGGTRFLWNALRAGDIDIYADYTGNALRGDTAGAAGR